MSFLFVIALILLSPTGSGQESAPREPFVVKVLNRVSPDRIEANIRSLTRYPTRHTLSIHNVEAAGWLRDRFRAIGYDDVDFHDFNLGGATRHNVVCTKRGQSTPHQLVLVCAHYDSRNERIGDFEGPAPGAVDNASGTAALLELARVLKDVPTGRSVRFVAFSGEEQGLAGSRAYAKRMSEEMAKIVLVVNLDMIGHPMDESGRLIVVEHDPGLSRADNDAGSLTWADRLALASRYTSLKPRRGPMYGSDYLPFERFGYVCVGLFDGADSASFYHSSADTIEKVDFAYCGDATRMVLATVLDAAEAAAP